jgi:hypothetical protein
MASSLARFLRSRADTREPVRFSASGLLPTVVQRLPSVVGHFGPTQGASSSVWTIAGLGWRLSWLEVGVNLQAMDITGVGHQVGGQLRAFYRGCNDMGDIAVDYAFQGLQAGNKFLGVP